MGAKTLVERVLMDFSIVNIKNAFIRVPKLNGKKEKIRQNKKIVNIRKKDFNSSSLMHILIKSAIENAKKTKKQALPVFSSDEEDKSYTIIKDDKDKNIGGYGTISKGYVIAPSTSYVNYSKLYSHVGNFKSQSPYENMAEHLGFLNKSTESGSFTLMDTQTMDKMGRYVKYLRPANPTFDIHTMATSLVPLHGMSSAEWEQFRLWLMLDPVMYALKTRTA